jgi:hypothetical protein
MYSYVVDPKNNLKYHTNSNEGQNIINNYHKHFNQKGGVFNLFGSSDNNSSDTTVTPSNIQSDTQSDTSSNIDVKSNSSLGNSIKEKGKSFLKKTYDLGDKGMHIIKKKRQDSKNKEIVLETSKYNQAFESKKPLLLDLYLKNIEKYDDKEYQDAVIRDGCRTAWYIITNLKDLNLNKNISCKEYRDKEKNKLKQTMDEIDKQDKISEQIISELSSET